MTPTGNGANGAAVINGGSAPQEADHPSDLLRELYGHVVAEHRTRRLHKEWFKDLVDAYLRHRSVARAGRVRVADGSESEQALAIVENACLKASATGLASGLLSTGATMLGAANGWSALFTVPATAAGIGVEMFYRAVIHLELTNDLAELFGVPFDQEPGELWRIYALAFRTHAHVEDDPGQEVVHKIAEAESDEVGEAVAGKLLGESLAKNVVPFVGIGASTVQNWLITRRLGDFVRRYVRYQRALRDAFIRDARVCEGHMDLIVEGFWFVFTADGNLAEEEAATLARLYDRFDEKTQAALRDRFTVDQGGFLERCKQLPERARNAFLHAMELAAAVDKKFTLPEQRLLEQVAIALHRPFVPARIFELIRRFNDEGVLAGVEGVVSPHPGPPGQPLPV
jgi:hypothetical protein